MTLNTYLAIQIKLDELIRVTKGAHNTLIALEESEDKNLEEMSKKYSMIANEAIQSLAKGNIDTGTSDC